MNAKFTVELAKSCAVEIDNTRPCPDAGTRKHHRAAIIARYINTATEALRQELNSLKADIEKCAEAFETLACSFPAIQVDSTTPNEAALFINAEFEKVMQQSEALAKENERLKSVADNHIESARISLAEAATLKASLIEVQKELAVSKSHDQLEASMKELEITAANAISDWLGEKKHRDQLRDKLEQVEHELGLIGSSCYSGDSFEKHFRDLFYRCEKIRQTLTTPNP